MRELLQVYLLEHKQAQYLQTFKTFSNFQYIRKEALKASAILERQNKQ